MDRSELSAAIITEMETVVQAALEQGVPRLLEGDLASMEEQAQQLGRVILGRLLEVTMAQRARALPRPAHCGQCGGALRERERPRQMQGLVGDYRLERTYYWCGGCGQSQVPLDAELGVGPGVLSPGLARVVARAAIEVPFAQAVDTVHEALGVAVSAEVARRATEGLGAVAEAQVQAAIARAAQGRATWAPAETDAAEDTATLAVGVDGVRVQRDGEWHEMKVVTLAPLGPDLHTDAQSGRTHLAWGAASYGAGTEGAEDFWWRVYVEACRRGLGTAAVRTVVVLGDGAAWIWDRARTFLGVPDTEVVEIVDIYHAYGYLWDIGNAIFGAGSPAASAWVEPLKDRLYTHGAAPILAALAALSPLPDAAAEAHHDALSYFTTNSARMDYPRFVARDLPIGSGAVESTCKCLIEARAKQAGMRWSGAGVQRVASLRALQRSGRWAAFWQAQPQRQRSALAPRTPRPAVSPAPPSPADALPLALTAPAVPALPQPTVPRPSKPTARQRPLLLPRSA
jgi:hypothetical protein